MPGDAIAGIAVRLHCRDRVLPPTALRPGLTSRTSFDLGIVFLEDAVELPGDSFEIPESLLENLVALNGPFIDASELLGGVEILVPRLRFPLSQAFGTAAQFVASTAARQLQNSGE